MGSNAHRFDGHHRAACSYHIKLSAENEGGRENGSALKLPSAHVASECILPQLFSLQPGVFASAHSQVDGDPEFVGPHICVPIIVYLDKTTLDGLGRTSAFPLYISVANFSWKVYNDTTGMQLAALLLALWRMPTGPSQDGSQSPKGLEKRSATS